MIKKIDLSFYLIVFCSLLTFISCTKEIEIDTRGFEKKLVVNSVFRQDKPFFFRFSFTEVPINSYSVINDSIHVMLFEDNKKVLDTKVLSDTLQTDILPVFSRTYMLKVCVEGFDTIYAYDTIPQSVYIDDATIIQPIAINKYGDRISQASITFSDPPGQRNYYELLIGKNYDYETEITDPVLLNEGDIGYRPTTYFFSDELFNGQKYTLRINKDLGFNVPVKTILRSVSRNYYMYRKYWTRHYFNQTTDESGLRGIIYKAEPQPMFNNIINGYGIFAGYIESSPYTLHKVNAK
ncbi:MAG: DUF4249 domain-containing protein [Paludibacteraceae bacterium]|nr:DUF4249 domain-containing protein [Paludibacteraceae bacterium]